MALSWQVSALLLFLLRALFSAAALRFLRPFLHSPGSPRPPGSQLAGVLFCTCFCEPSLLLATVFLGSALHRPTAIASWNFSLLALVPSLVFFLPLLQSLLLASALRSSSARFSAALTCPHTLALAALPFALYLFLYYRLGQSVQALLGVQSGSHAFGLLNTTLARICVPGVVLIASLSGAGAVNTAWHTYNRCCSRFRASVTDVHLSQVEQALSRTRSQLSDRHSALQLHLASTLQSDADPLPISLFSGSAANASSTRLQQEIAGLQALEKQMSSDLGRLKEIRDHGEYSRTIPGRLANVANWCLSLYCVYRLVMACVNLLLGYVGRPVRDGNGLPERKQGGATTDIVTLVIARVLTTFRFDLDLDKLSRLVGLGLIGSIIGANLRAVLVWVDRVFCRVTNLSRGVSGSLIVLVLAQLMAVYLLTCLISLPTPGGSGNPSPHGSPGALPDQEHGAEPRGESLQDLVNTTLPSFQRFSKLFDVVFLASGVVTGLLRWMGKLIEQPRDHWELCGQEEHSTEGHHV